MKTRLYATLMLLGFLLLTACGSGGDGETSTTNCTVGSSALGSCTLN